MSHAKHGASRGPNPLIFVIVALIVIAVILAAVLLLTRGTDREEPQPAVSLPLLEETMPPEEAQTGENTAVVPAAEEARGTAMAIQEDPDGDVWVETPYCDLIYPFEMSDALRVRSESVDDGLTVIFYGSINDVEEALYAIHFGVETGFPVGTLSLADGTEIGVWTEIFEIEPEASWGEGEINTLYAMQECVNDTLAQLQQEAGFTAAE